MIVSHKFNLVFIHIPKTGGSFIWETLLKLDPSAIRITDFEGVNLFGHLQLRDIERLDIYEDIKSYSFFTSIRNPLERYVSTYNYILSEPAHGEHSRVKEKNLSFYEFANTNHQHVGVMVDYITNKNGKINKNIKLLRCNNLNGDLNNFLSNLNVPEDDLKRIEPFMKKPSNVSEKFFKEDIDISKLNLNDFHLKDLMFYLSLENVKKI